MGFLVGCAGVPYSTPKPRDTAAGIRKARELQLSALELEFVRKVYLSEDAAKDVGKVARENDIALTCHASYFVNLNSKDSEKREASKQRILQSARIGAIAGAKSVAFHPAALQKMPSEAVYKIVKAELKEVLDILKKEKISVSIAPETAGKKGNFGSWKETIDLAKELGCGACIDFAHIWARAEGEVDFDEVVDYYVKNLGKTNMHVHISGINFTGQGEKNHTMFAQSKFPLKDALASLVKHGCSGIIICESPVQDSDALVIQKLLEQF